MVTSPERRLAALEEKPTPEKEDDGEKETPAEARFVPRKTF